MDISQTPLTEDKDEPAKKDDQTDQPSGGYYYDDTTGYEIYDGEDETDEEESGDPDSQSATKDPLI